MDPSDGDDWKLLQLLCQENDSTTIRIPRFYPDREGLTRLIANAAGVRGRREHQNTYALLIDDDLKWRLLLSASTRCASLQFWRILTEMQPLAMRAARLNENHRVPQGARGIRVACQAAIL